MRAVWYRRAVLFLALGLATSIAVAFVVSVPAAPGLPRMAMVGPIGTDRWLVGRSDHRGSTRIEAVRVRADDKVQYLPNTGTYIITFVSPGMRVIFDGRSPSTTAASPPGWMGLRDAPDPVDTAATVACGWPVRCLKAEATGTIAAQMDPSLVRTRGAVRFRPMPASLASVFPAINGISSRIDGVFPLLPIWSGLTLDAALYACGWVFLWLLWREARGARGVRRRRRGLCPACAYDLCSDFAPGCPECGWGKPPA